ncbi:hypothetical protein NQ318_002907 [Aromia moschata]|uniref:Uncharacterized protein n=1 Tax=Aromia moschata TaxID=1265417 RepID=A0AAV8X5X2_9CUCU|nr:hypothetical protein NQ318_002907 [Aromia moschata]
MEIIGLGVNINSYSPITLSILQVKNAHRISSYSDFRNVVKFEGIEFPIELNDILKFERLKQRFREYASDDYTINKKEILPVCLTKITEKIVNLLMVPSTININDIAMDTDTPLYHFAWMKDMPCPLSKQISLHNEILDRHTLDCTSKTNSCKIELLGEREHILKFKNYQLQGKSAICYLCRFRKHTAFSVAYYLKCSYDGSLSEFKLYRGRDCQQWFINPLTPKRTQFFVLFGASISKGN